MRNEHLSIARKHATRELFELLSLKNSVYKGKWETLIH